MSRWSAGRILTWSKKCLRTCKAVSFYTWQNGFDHSRFNLVGKKIVCADCGKIMGFRTEGTRHINKFYRCKTYLDTTKKGCTNHKVSLETVNRAVFEAVREHMKLCVDTEDAVRRKNGGG